MKQIIQSVFFLPSFRGVSTYVYLTPKVRSSADRSCFLQASDSVLTNLLIRCDIYHLKQNTRMDLKRHLNKK